MTTLVLLALDGLKSTHATGAGGFLGLANTGQLISPIALVILCIVAGVGTVMLLPGRRSIHLHRAGGAILLVAGLILGAMLVRLEWGSAGELVRIYFWIFTVVGLFSAVRVVTHPRPVYSALYFVLTVFASAGLFVLMEAEFMAAALILIYAGAILITYVFVIMLASQASTGDSPTAVAVITEYDTISREPLAASAVGFALAFVLLFVIFDRANHILPAGPVMLPVATASEGPAVAEYPTQPLVKVSGNTEELGMFLFRHQFVQMDVAGLMLALAMVGAIVIARRQVLISDEHGSPTEPKTDVVIGPSTPVDDNPHSIPVYGTDKPGQKAYPQT